MLAIYRSTWHAHRPESSQPSCTVYCREAADGPVWALTASSQATHQGPICQPSACRQFLLELRWHGRRLQGNLQAIKGGPARPTLVSIRTRQTDLSLLSSWCRGTGEDFAPWLPDRRAAGQLPAQPAEAPWHTFKPVQSLHNSASFGGGPRLRTALHCCPCGAMTSSFCASVLAGPQ